MFEKLTPEYPFLPPKAVILADPLPLASIAPVLASVTSTVPGLVLFRYVAPRVLIS